MMSPGQPIYPRSTSVTASTMAESPRPIHPAAFPHQLPPIMTAPRFTISGPVLAPLAMSSSGSGPSAVSRPTAHSPHSHQRRGPPSVPPAHAPPPPHHHSGTLPHSHHSHQQPHPPQQQQAPLAPQASHHGRVHSYDAQQHRLLSSQPAFNSPPPSGFSSPASFSHFERTFDNRRFSNETDQEHRRSSLVPSPSFPVTRPFEESPNYPDETPRTGYSSSTLRPASVDENAASSGESFSRRSLGRYQIQVRQQPVAARACGFGERDRRVIDPPPIVQLVVNDTAGRSDSAEMRYPFNVVHCTLWSIDGNTDETALIGVDKRLTRRLMGTLVSSPFVGLDEEGKEGCFFCFPDLSCRTHGKYRLRFVLMRLEPSDLQPEGYTPIITEAMSDVFTVYTAKEFPGMRPSTALTKALKRQGCAISVKKGNEKAIGQVGGSGKDDGSGDEDTPSSTAGKSKRRRKT